MEYTHTYRSARLSALYLINYITEQKAFTGLQTEQTAPIERRLAFTEVLSVTCNKHALIAKTDNNNVWHITSLHYNNYNNNDTLHIGAVITLTLQLVHLTNEEQHQAAADCVHIIAQTTNQYIVRFAILHCLSDCVLAYYVFLSTGFVPESNAHDTCTISSDLWVTR